MKQTRKPIKKYEMNMMGSRTLNLLNKRLKTIFPKSEEEFGGISIILVGDFGQLSPVKDIPMWKKQFGDDAIMGYNAYRTFKKAISLSVVRRQKDQKFKKLLMRIRNGGMKKKDCQSVWKELLTGIHDYFSFQMIMKISSGYFILIKVFMTITLKNCLPYTDLT